MYSAPIIALSKWVDIVYNTHRLITLHLHTLWAIASFFLITFVGNVIKKNLLNVPASLLIYTNKQNRSICL